MKKFLAILFLLAVVGSAGYLIIQEGQKVQVSEDSLKEASYYQTLDNNMVQCLLCPRKCILSEGQRGVREVNQGPAQ